VQLDNPDTQHLHLDTKVQQLDFAIKIELWQEAFKAIEDIHTLMCMSKRPPKPNLLNDFCSKMCKVFVKSESMLFHACTIFKLFKLHKEQKRNPTREDLTKKASKLLVATLSVPITKQKHGVGKILDMEGAIINKVVHLSKLLGLEKAPTREALLDDFMKYNLIEYVPRQLKELYEWLELKNHPLKMADRVSSVFEWMSEQTAEPELVNYIPHLRQVVITRVLQQVSSLYKSISFKRLMKFLPAEYCSKIELEQFIVDASRNGQLQVRIDHMKNCVYMGTDLNASPLYVEDEFFESKRLQALPSERVSASFNKTVRSMMQAHHALNSHNIQEERELKMRELLNLYNKTKAKTHSLMLRRRQIIEDRKERMESEKRTQEQEERLAAQKQEAAVRAAEQARIDKEQRERRTRLQQEQQKAEDLQKANDKLEMLKKTEIGKKLFENVQADDIMKNDFNTEDMVNKQIVLKEKEKKEINDRRKAQEKKIDHFERAKRKVEIPLLEKHISEKKVKDEDLWIESEKERVEKSVEEYKRCVETKERLVRMKRDVNDHMKPLREAQQQQHQASMESWMKELEEVRAERLAQRKYERKLQRFAKRMQQKQEEAEERRLKQIEMEREQEEERRRKEEQTRQEKIQEERRRRDEQAQKQRQRELEIEQKMKNMKLGQQQRSEPAASTPWRPSRRAQQENTGGDNWGRRGAQQESGGDSWSRRGAQQESGGDSWRSTPQRSSEDNRPPSGGGRFSNLNSERRNDSRSSGGRFARFQDDNRGGGRFGDNRSGKFQDEPRSGRFQDEPRGGRNDSFRSRRADSSDWGRGTPAGRERRENPQGRSDSPSTNMRRGEPAGQQSWRSQNNSSRARGEGPARRLEDLPRGAREEGISRKIPQNEARPQQDDGWTQVKKR